MENRSVGISFPGLLFLVFLVLKLTGVIAWSWWWVTSPLWIVVLAVPTVVFLIGMIGAIAEWVSDKIEEYKLNKK